MCKLSEMFNYMYTVSALLLYTIQDVIKVRGFTSTVIKRTKVLCAKFKHKAKKNKYFNPFLRLDVQISKIFFYGENIFLLELGIKIFEIIADSKN